MLLKIDGCHWARPGLYRFCIWMMATLLLVMAYAWTIAPRYRFYINATPSMPGRLYLVELRERPPRRGELVAFQPPPTPAYPPDAVFLKYVVGLPGDRVETSGRQWHLNQRLLGRIKRHALSGRRLEPGPQGHIPVGRYAMWSPEEDSYDSRYQEIGWIDRNRIIGFARRVF